MEEEKEISSNQVLLQQTKPKYASDQMYFGRDFEIVVGRGEQE